MANLGIKLACLRIKGRFAALSCQQFQTNHSWCSETLSRHQGRNTMLEEAWCQMEEKHHEHK